MSTDLEKLLDTAINAARRRPGMASIRLDWNPYAFEWEAEANWSDAHVVRTSGSEIACDAVLELIDLLGSNP